MGQPPLPESAIGGLSKERKIGFTLLLIFTVITVTLGILQIRNTLYAPFALNNEVPVSYKDQLNSVDALRYRDTDHDGLSDFDELYVYHTSPYLYDTFGYGMSDKEVIEKGLPLCPKGQDCTAGDNGQEVVNSAPASSTLQQTFGVDTPPPDISAMLHDPNQLRKLLLQSGVDATTLSKVSDSDLQKMVNQLLASSSTAFSSLVSAPTSTP